MISQRHLYFLTMAELGPWKGWKVVDPWTSSSPSWVKRRLCGHQEYLAENERENLAVELKTLATIV